MSRFPRRVLKWARKWGPQVGADSLLILAAYVAAAVTRFEFHIPAEYRAIVFQFAWVAVVVHLVVGWFFKLYREVWAHASVRQALRLVLAFGASGLVLCLLGMVWQPDVPVSVRLFGPVLSLMLVGFVRFRDRLRTPRRASRAHGGSRVVVVGAGEVGAAIIRETERARTSGLVPVAIVDDDESLHGRTVLGLPVAGSIDALGDAVRRYKADQVLLAIAGAPQALVRRVFRTCEELEVPMRLLPRVEELLGGRISVRDVRELSIEDLIGRQPVHTDLAAVSAALDGKKVLITGAGGSIGSEISRQVARFRPSELVLLDHDETHLHDVAALLSDARVDMVLADIRDRARMATLLRQLRPDFVFHAAAHKHVPLLEAHPTEAYWTNVVGTRNLVEASLAAGVGRFVLISTDKAVRPSSVMGASKRLAEQLTLVSSAGTGCYCAVRFGNVLGSRGSVIPTFARQLAAGGPLTVTDPEMTRFFISTPEAVQLVLQAATMAEGGEIFMLEMGNPTNIADLARRMIRLSGRTVGTDVEIKFTGMRPGEKLVEELSAPGEEAEATAHESIVRLRTPFIDAADLEECFRQLERAALAYDDASVASLLLQVSHPEASLSGSRFGDSLGSAITR